MQDEQKIVSQNEDAGREQEALPKKKKKKRSTGKKVAIVLIWIAVIVAIAFIVLFLASKIGQFDSIGDMIDYIKTQI